MKKYFTYALACLAFSGFCLLYAFQFEACATVRTYGFSALILAAAFVFVFMAGSERGKSRYGGRMMEHGDIPIDKAFEVVENFFVQGVPVDVIIYYADTKDEQVFVKDPYFLGSFELEKGKAYTRDLEDYFNEI